MKIYLLLSLEFFKIGLFSFGGGYATLPFLYHLSSEYHWYSIKELVQMLGVAAVTPGPIGINMATYAGFETAGFLGASIATVSVILPSLIIVIAVSKLLKNFKDNFYVQSALFGLRPAACAMIAAVGFKLFKDSVMTFDKIPPTMNIFEFFDLKAVVLFVVLLIFAIKSKKDPIIHLFLSAFAGVMIYGIKI